MPPKNEKRGRGRGKRPRESSREEGTPQAPFAAAKYAPQSNIAQAGTSFGRPLPPSSSGTGPVSGNTPSSSEIQYGQPVNVITSYPPPGKVAIPALRPPQSFDSSVKGSKKGRTSHACDYCRKAKAGCTGQQPCARCRNARVACIYGDGKREHGRKMMTKLSRDSISLSQHNADVTDALRRIQLDTALSYQGLRNAIHDVLAMTPAPISPGSRGDSAAPSCRSSPEPAEREASAELEEEGAEVGSTGSLDVINVDTDRDDTRATGHMGKTSAVSWAKRTTEEFRRTSLQESAAGRYDTGFALSSYHVEDADVEFVDTTNVNPYDWPEYNLADTLVRLYFDHAHTAFPILDRANFMAKYRSFTRRSSDLDPSEVIWLGTLNAIFAISAVFGDLTNCDDQGHVDDHLIYCARAKMLCMDQSLLFQDARVSTTCFLGLMSLYYVSICKLNRAWTICGFAIRNGLTLGLHVRSEVDTLSDVDKEHRVRLWWSLYSLEVLLNELTGRPSCISDRDISTPLPVNIDENNFLANRPLYEREDSGQTPHTGSSSRRSSKGRPSATYQMPVGYSHPSAFSFPVVELPVTSSTYFIYRTQLSIISHEIVTQLYCAATIKEKWSEVQSTIRTIDRRLLSWRDSLPKEFDIMFDTWTEPDWNDPYTLPRIGLAIFFNSSRMILFRPCLCRVEGRLDNQSQVSKDFEQEAVQNCIHSARRMINVLKWNAKNEARFYAISPWWNTLHSLCEALSVLMLEMAFEAQHLPNEAADILADAKQGIYWLAMLSAGSIAARKAWEIFDNLIRLVAVKIKWSVFDLPTAVPVPARYNWRRFGKPNTSAWNQLSHENLQEYQASQPALPDSTTTWANQDLNQYFPEQCAALEHFSNQLESSAAVERFANMGQLRGQYDAPWQQLFIPSAAGPSIGIPAPSLDTRPFRPAIGGSERFLTQSAFDRNVGGYETLSPTNVHAFPRNVQFEEQAEQEVNMQRPQSEYRGFQGSDF